MHSGYPVMLHQYHVRTIADVSRMFSKGSWGAIHELGHNQQRDVWGKLRGWEMRPYTTEATCNLWSIYVHEQVCWVLQISAELSRLFT